MLLCRSNASAIRRSIFEFVLLLALSLNSQMIKRSYSLDLSNSPREYFGHPLCGITVEAAALTSLTSLRVRSCFTTSCYALPE